MKKTARKVLLMACSALLLVCLTVGATVAYLTSTDTVTNTFTVGKVKIELDEAKVGTDGKALTGDNAARVKENTYNRIIPGVAYDKDPTVTVKAGSEDSYVRVKVTVNQLAILDEIFASEGAPLASIFGGHDQTKWVYEGETEANDTITYEFRYHKVVPYATADTKLEPVFETVTLPGEIVDETDLAKLGDKEVKITVVAEAIQASNFTSEDAAWDAFDKQN